MPSWTNRLRGLPPVIAATVLLLSISAAAVAISTVVNIGHFRDVGYPDSATMLAVRDFVQSGRIYHAVDRPPYLVTIYGPLTYGLLSIPYRLTALIGVRPELAVRATIVLAFLACLALVFLISRRMQPSSKVAWFSVLFAAAVLPLARWTTQVRGDFPALALSLLGVYVILRSPALSRVAVAAFCAGLGLLVKQTFIAAPASIVFWLLWTRRFKAAAVFAGVVVLTVAGGYSFVLWREPLMAEHLRALRTPVFEFHGAIGLLWAAFAQPLIPFAAAGAVMAPSRYGDTGRFVLLLCGMSWLVAAGGVMQAGANINYFWEPLFLSAILAGPALDELRRRLEGASRLVITTVLFLLLHASLPAMKGSFDAVVQASRQVRNYTARRERWEEFMAVIHDRRLLSTIPSVTARSALPEMPDPFLNTVLAARGRWDASPVIENLDAARYDLVVVLRTDVDQPTFYRGWPVWSSQVWGAVNRRYRPACTLNDTQIYLPPGRPGELYNRLTAIGCRPVRTGIVAPANGARGAE